MSERDGVWVERAALRNLYDLVVSLTNDLPKYSDVSWSLEHRIRGIRAEMEWSIVPYVWVNND